MIQVKVSFTITAIAVSITQNISAVTVVVAAGVEHSMSTNGLRKQRDAYSKLNTAT